MLWENKNFARKVLEDKSWLIHNTWGSSTYVCKICSFPDVMMPSYSQNKWYAIYFVSYLCTMLYVMMNLMLAVVNETFTSRERDKFKKLFLHKRKACQHAFRLLVSKQNPDKMRFRQFEGLMRYYAPNKCTCSRIIFDEFRWMSDSVTLFIKYLI